MNRWLTLILTLSIALMPAAAMAKGKDAAPGQLVAQERHQTKSALNTSSAMVLPTQIDEQRGKSGPLSPTEIDHNNDLTGQLVLTTQHIYHRQPMIGVAGPRRGESVTTTKWILTHHVYNANQGQSQAAPASALKEWWKLVANGRQIVSHQVAPTDFVHHNIWRLRTSITPPHDGNGNGGGNGDGDGDGLNGVGGDPGIKGVTMGPEIGTVLFPAGSSLLYLLGLLIALANFHYFRTNRKTFRSAFRRLKKIVYQLAPAPA